MIAIQDKTLHAEITAMLNSKKGKEFVMDTLFNETPPNDLEIEFHVGKELVTIYANSEKMYLDTKMAQEYFKGGIPSSLWRKTWVWLRSIVKEISFEEFEDLLLLIK